ncbi:DUF309 domain-containing protein, partial [Halorubrum sp. Ea1]|uniref:DUF309 domain-containing protein n=1 Tax=Halorubrum sp. Ea1 TaxID=1480718 RepID=UPI0011402744
DDRGDDPDDPPSVSAAVAAGAALFNEGHTLAAHDPWEAAWLPLDEGDDERLLHGLIAAAAATHHASERNWSGATGCAANAVRYLDGLDAEAARGDGGGTRGVDVATVREWCRRLATDPETVERSEPPPIRVGDAVPRFADLDLAAALLAAPPLAEAVDHGDPGTFEAAAALAREERGTGRTRFAELLFAFLREPDARPQVAARLADHVDLAERKRRDVDDLF